MRMCKRGVRPQHVLQSAEPQRTLGTDSCMHCPQLLQPTPTLLHNHCGHPEALIISLSLLLLLLRGWAAACCILDFQRFQLLWKAGQGRWGICREQS